MKIIKEIDHDVQTVREMRVFVRQYVFADGMSSYDVLLENGEITGPDGEKTDNLTENSFDHMPSAEEIEQLPYIRPSVATERPGVYYIRSAHFRQGPYRSRTGAWDDIRKGKW